MTGCYLQPWFCSSSSKLLIWVIVYVVWSFVLSTNAETPCGSCYMTQHLIIGFPSQHNEHSRNNSSIHAFLICTVTLWYILLYSLNEVKYLSLFFPGGSLADLIERNKKSNEVMGEAELKQLLIQVAQVI